MNLRNLSAIIIILGFVGCFGLLLGVICGLEGYQNAGIDLFMIGFVSIVIGGTVAMLYWRGKDQSVFLRMFGSYARINSRPVDTETWKVS